MDLQVWQFYAPESTMSYLTEMAGLATHNFWSAAAGFAGENQLAFEYARPRTDESGIRFRSPHRA
jgi:K+-transporting ATPase ATPase A chain